MAEVALFDEASWAEGAPIRAGGGAGGAGGSANPSPVALRDERRKEERLGAQRTRFKVGDHVVYGGALCSVTTVQLSGKMDLKDQDLKAHYYTDPRDCRLATEAEMAPAPRGHQEPGMVGLGAGGLGGAAGVG